MELTFLLGVKKRWYTLAPKRDRKKIDHTLQKRQNHKYNVPDINNNSYI